ncbi:MAG: Alpha-monoglucosyldiacylglycerol synthase [Firmicutes bacterium ADurb.Bin248]|nr:MAG: Alpha-monoglucosyldiacylglycerol synthase [Firmicutes bacterium ADurb.Bin248]
MRIGQFTDSFYPIVDGVGRVVYNYARALPAMGDECYVVAPMTDTGYRGGYPFELIDYTGMPLPGSPQYKAGLAVLDRHYYERIEAVTLDIAHTPFFSGQEALRLAAKHDVPLVGTFHSKYYDDFYKLTRAELLASIGVRFVVEFYERCDEVWAVSKTSASALRDYGFKGEIVVMENGAELRPVNPEDRAAAAARYRIDLGHPVLLYVGQLNWKKNILLILEGAALLKRQGRRFSVVLAGQGPDEEAIRRKSRELGLGENVVFTGHVRDTALLDGLYQCASLFAFPSLYDTFSLVVREAAVMGTPSVLSRGSAAAEPVRDGVNGLLCRPEAEDFAAVVGANMEDEHKLAALGEAAKRTIPVGWDQVMEKVRARYQALIERCRTEEMKKRHALIRAGFLRDHAFFREKENRYDK